MKIRTGFVSNSSSSSFLLFVPKNDKTINTINEYKEFIMNEFGFSADSESDMEELEQIVSYNEDQIQKEFAKGNGFIYDSIEYGCDETLMRVINTLGYKIIITD